MGKKDAWKERWVELDLLDNNSGQGMTYFAAQVGETQPRYVLKKLKKQKDPERRGRMYQEVANLRILEYPGIARYEDSNAHQFKEEVDLYLVTERIVGSRLDQYTGDKPLSLAEAIRITAILLDTLKFCHDRPKPVVHRDIKPANIIMREGPLSTPVLIDFGLSFNEDTQSTDFATEPGQHLGNRFYWLPELSVRGHDKRNTVSDVTQCVAIFFYLLTGFSPDAPLDGSNRPPHQRDDARKIIEGHEPHVIRKLDRIFKMGFAHDVIERWQSAEDLKAAVLAVSDADGAGFDFGAELRSIREEYDARPSAKVHSIVQALKQLANKTADSTLNRINSEMNHILNCGGGVNREAEHPIAYYERTYELYLRQVAAKPLEGSLRIERREQNVVVTSKFVGREETLLDCSVFDPDVLERVVESIERQLAHSVREALAKVPTT